MSMNLCIECDGKMLGLYQTPTFITTMCMLDHLGEVQWEFRGPNPQGDLPRRAASGHVGETPMGRQHLDGRDRGKRKISLPA